MTSTDVKGPESMGDPRANEAAGGAAGAAPVPAQQGLADAGPALEEPQGGIEEEALSVGRGATPGAAAAAALSRAQRSRSFEVADFERPVTKQEEWRFTPLRVMAPLFEDAPTDDRDGDPAVDYQIEAPSDITQGVLAPGEAPRGTVLVPEDIVAAVASVRTEQALHLRAAKNTEVSEPARVEITGRGADRRGNAHIVLETEESASATFVLNHTGSARYAQNVEMVLGQNSQMTVISLHDWDDDALHIAQHHAKIARDAKLKHIVVTLGGRAVRVNAVGELVEPGGEVEKLGLYFSDASQYLEHRLFVDHAAPNCTSNSTYKGALQGQGARSVWVGDVLIRKVAEGTNTYELNRNLVLTDGARADSVPNLEIETGEIEGAGHAAATGRFDDEQLFYLRSRGIPELEARRLVVRGFFAELIQQIDVPEIREHLTESIENELARSMN
ncbi:MAG: Fe-S cluster assembly protein SufD [Brachybacterium sp.]|nr:Fe-S cluster assembly protein SufD [Brachybacterium sp.]